MQKKIVNHTLLFTMILILAIGTIPFQLRIINEVQPSLNAISSSQMKSLDGSVDLSYSHSYIMESEIPHLSAVMKTPTVGDVSILALTVCFPDLPNSASKAQIESRWDDQAGDYFLENSFGLLSIDSMVTPWIEAPKSISYYADDSAGYSAREMELAEFLLDYWDPVIDYNEYNYIYIIYAGTDEQDDTHFWPHVWWFGGSIPAGDGISYDKLGFVGEFTPMGVYAHEFGHSMGLVDYYSLDSDYPCGYWEIMGMGGWNDGGDHPAHMGAYSKMELGWIDEENILVMDESLDQVAQINLHALEDPICPEGSYQVIKIPEDEEHYYLVEFRDSIGYDAYLPDTGVLLSYVDETKGSTEGRLTYIGGDHSHPNLNGMELDDDELTDAENFVRWLKDDFELIVSAIQEHSTSMDVLIDCCHDLGTGYTWHMGLPAGSQLVWTETSLVKGDVIVFFWDADAGSGSDFYLQQLQGSTWVNLMVKSNIWQDAVVFHVHEDGDYKLIVKNNNIMFSIDVAYELYVCEHLTIEIEELLLPPDPYHDPPTNYFNVSITLSTHGTAWITNVNLTINFHCFNMITLLTDEEEFFGILMLPNQALTFSMLIELIQESYNQITITIFSEYFVDELGYHEFSVIWDLEPPEVCFTEIARSGNEVYLEWDAHDYVTGISQCYLLLNGQLHSNYTFGQTSDIIILPEEGYYEFIIIAWDNSNNTGQDLATILYDETAPVLQIHAPNNPMKYRMFEFQVFGSDNLDVGMNLSIFFNGIYYESTLISSSEFKLYSLMNVSDYCSISDKELVIRVLVQDVAGNEFELTLTLPIEEDAQNLDVIPLSHIILTLGLVSGLSSIGIVIGIGIKRRSKILLKS